MDSVLLITISAFILAVILIIVTIVIIKRNQNKKYKKEIEELDIRKNNLIGVPVLSEITKVKELIKTDNLKNKLDDWDNTFTTIRDEKIPELTDLISEADFLIDRKDYKQAVKKITNIEIEINSLKKKTDHLLEEVKLITNSEERNRALITKLKIVYREDQNKFERSKKEYGVIADYLEKEIDNIDDLFAKFEKAMDNNDYVSVEKKINLLDDKITKLGKLLEDIPTIVLMATVLVPNKIDEAITYYYRMKRDGYPLDYLNVEYNIKEIKNKIDNIMENLKKLELGESIIELKTFIEYFNELYNDFDKEKECKDLFRQNIKEFSYKIDNIKYNYNLSDEDINKFSILNKNLEKINQDYKILVDQGKMKTFAYSKLVDELNGLSLKLSRLQDDLDFQLRSITSMKDDETRAREQLATIENLLKKAKYRLKDYKIPVIPSSYYIELTEAQDAIREIIKELDRKPIVIKILNIRVDTARDLVFKIYNKTNDMIKIASMSEKIIIYGNRYRSSYEEIDIALTKAEELFKRGKYKESLDLSMKCLSFIDKNVTEKF